MTLLTLLGAAGWISHVADAQGNNGAGATTLALACDAATNGSDVLVAAFAVASPATVTGVPSGWTAVTGSPASTSTGARLYAYTATKVGAGTQTFTWTLSASAVATGGISTYRSVDFATSIDVVSAAAALNNPHPTAPAVTTTAGSDWLVTVAADDGASRTWSALGSQVLRWSAGTALGAALSDSGFAVGVGLQVAQSIDLSGAAPWAILTLALRPAQANLFPATTNVAVAVPAPSVTHSTTVNPAAVAIAVAVPSQPVSAGATVTVGAVTVVIAEPSTVIGGGVGVSPAAINVAIVVPVPAAFGSSPDVTYTQPSPLAVVVTAQPPAVSGSAPQAPATRNVAVAVLGPTITISSIVRPAPVAVAVAARAPAATADATASPPAARVAVGVPMPSVAANRSVVVAVSAVTVAATVPSQQVNLVSFDLSLLDFAVDAEPLLRVLVGAGVSYAPLAAAASGGGGGSAVPTFGSFVATTVARSLGTGAANSVSVQNDPDNTNDILVGDASNQVIQLAPGQVGTTTDLTSLSQISVRTVTGTAVVNWEAGT